MQCLGVIQEAWLLEDIAQCLPGNPGGSWTGVKRNSRSAMGSSMISFCVDSLQVGDHVCRSIRPSSSDENAANPGKFAALPISHLRCVAG
jgi:hypothetical protein